jgi:glycosyltransferase involved in cell wall biosynthesis
MLASPAPGGAEMLVRNLSAEFGRQGHDCRMLFMSDAAGVGNPPEFERDFLAGLAADGVGHEIMPPGAFRSVLAGARALRRAVAAFRPDILHIHLARGLMCRSFSGLRVATVYTHHNVVTNFSPWLFRLFDRSVDRYVAIGTACRALLERHVRRPIVSIPNGVPAAFAAGEPRTFLPKDPLVLGVGNLSTQKDYATLVAAAALAVPQFAAQGRRARFAIAGEGAERQRLQALIAGLGLAGEVELLGARPDVAALMGQAAALANSSAFEGLPITLIEGAMSGLPTVATDVGGNAEVVADGVNGLLVPPGRPDALADALVDLLSDEARYIRFSQAALAQGQRFTLDACVEAHLDLYRSLLGAERPAAGRPSDRDTGRRRGRP